MPSRNYDIIAGNLRRATGTLGNFEVTIDALQQLDPTGHGTHEWSISRQGGQSHCDIILDLRGGFLIIVGDSGFSFYQNHYFNVFHGPREELKVRVTAIPCECVEKAATGEELLRSTGRDAHWILREVFVGERHIGLHNVSNFLRCIGE